MPTGGVMDTKRPGRPSTSVSEKKVATLREMFKSNPSKSTRWGLLTASTIFYMNRNSSSEWKELSRRSFNLFSNLTLLSSRDFTSLDDKNEDNNESEEYENWDEDEEEEEEERKQLHCDFESGKVSLETLHKYILTTEVDNGVVLTLLATENVVFHQEC
ncbi:uncharacterized protein LOC126416331 [Schistocerca serialis cubense]|uniref:uncharacterized protein LOC126416331 n=1 Tax=Schistocerca serialis cubense TaxID=2023355 RepID=UPI00214F1D36|nr:uncharacterized protein LOC126416331 [Schistocerca serialis cubense]XP_049939953.1 uncharacterized protein LOC126416331 [Schistocerca serialis cubense]